jgi:glutamine cyclotransferase
MSRLLMLFVLGLSVLLGAASGICCSGLPESPVPGNSDATIYTYDIVNTYPHDRDAFTEGLAFEDGVLYEGTGRFGQSTLRRVELESGDVLQSLELSDEFFGEGITIYGDKIIQLTWQSNIGFVYDKSSFELLQEFTYPTEGWGITHNGTRLIMSDGTPTLHLLDPQTFEETGQLDVLDDDAPITRLNELEYIQGEIYANIWQTDWVARIAPETGQVIGWVNLRGLLTAEDRSESVDVLNGIAYDSKNDRLFVTGKLWPRLLEIEVISSP